VLVDQYILLQATNTLTSQTAAQALFDETGNGAVTLVAGTYEFDCVFSLSSMSSSSGSFGFALGGTATLSQYWRSVANKATLATAANGQVTYNTAANTTLIAANTNTVAYANISGVLIVTVGGTVIPQVSLGVAAAAVVGVGSFFKIRALGGAAVTSIGNWS